MRIFGQAELPLRFLVLPTIPSIPSHRLEGEPGAFASGYHYDLLSASEADHSEDISKVIKLFNQCLHTDKILIHILDLTSLQNKDFSLR